MKIYSVTCDNCQSNRTLERDALPGSVIGVQCKDCGAVFIAQFEGQLDRKARDKTQALQIATLEHFVENKPPLTVRQIFYGLEVHGLVPKTEQGYRQAQYQVLKMRRAGQIPYGWIADNTRWQIKPTTYKGLRDALENWQAAYRRDLWANQAAHVEIWIEKHALAGVIAPITRKYDVPLCPAHGFSSVTFLYEMAEEIKEIDKPTYVYCFGDHDPSGVLATESIRRELERHGAKIHFERVAITEAQIAQYNLPTRPTKTKGNAHAKRWGNKPSVELDALPPQELRRLVRMCIERHIDTYFPLPLREG